VTALVVFHLKFYSEYQWLLDFTAVLSNVFIYWGASDWWLWMRGRRVAIAIIIIIIITDGNLTMTKYLIKKIYCTYIISVKKEKVGLGGSRMGTKENNISKAGGPCS
jgi:hypothetical protein